MVVERNLKFKMLTVSYYYALYLKLNESLDFYLVLKQTNVSKDVFVKYWPRKTNTLLLTAEPKVTITELSTVFSDKPKEVKYIT